MKMAVTIDDGEIRFVNPDAIEDGSITYRARLSAPRQLQGIAELATDDPMISMVGGWSVKRVP